MEREDGGVSVKRMRADATEAPAHPVRGGAALASAYRMFYPPLDALAGASARPSAAATSGVEGRAAGERTRALDLFFTSAEDPGTQAELKELCGSVIPRESLRRSAQGVGASLQRAVEAQIRLMRAGDVSGRELASRMVGCGDVRASAEMASFLFLELLVGEENYRDACRECIDWGIATNAQRAIQACLEACERPGMAHGPSAQFGVVLFEALRDGVFQYFASRLTLCRWLVRRLEEHRRTLRVHGADPPAWEAQWSELDRALLKLLKGFRRPRAGQPSFMEGELSQLGSDAYHRIVVIMGIPSEFASERLVRGELSRFGMVEWVKVGTLGSTGPGADVVAHDCCAIASMQHSRDAQGASYFLDGAVLFAHVRTRAVVDVDGSYCHRIKPIATPITQPLDALAARVVTYRQGDAVGPNAGQSRPRKEWRFHAASSAPDIGPPPPTRPTAVLRL